MTVEATRGMIEVRHVAGSTQAAYDELYAADGLQQPRRVWLMVLEMLEVAPGMSLLDVACGEGQLVKLAAARGLAAHGVDLSMNAARRAHGPWHLAGVADGERLPYGDATFDRVVNFGSLEHYEDPGAGASEMARVLKPGGKALLQLPNTFGLRWSVLHAWRTGDVADDGQPLQRYGTRGQWTALLNAAGLTVERVTAYEDVRLAPTGVLGWAGVVRHPTRALVPLAGRLPVNMASMFLFVCTK